MIIPEVDKDAFVKCFLALPDLGEVTRLAMEGNSPQNSAFLHARIIAIKKITPRITPPWVSEGKVHLNVLILGSKFPLHFETMCFHHKKFLAALKKMGKV